MNLILSIVSFHKFTPDLLSEFTVNFDSEISKITFGRNDTCDWILPDPDMIVSGFQGEVYIDDNSNILLKDTSTNGIFYNNSVTPIGKGNEITLLDGDDIKFSNYEIKVEIPDLITSEEDDTEIEEFGLSVEEILSGNGDELVKNRVDFGFSDDFFDFDFKQKEISKKEIYHDVLSEDNINFFIKGMGISEDLLPHDINKWMEQAGRDFAILLNGITEILHNRTKFKVENNLNHTLFKREENNPFKYSSGLNDIIHNLYSRKTSTFLESEEAIKLAFHDIKLHDNAMLNSMSEALDSINNILSPSEIKKQNNSKILKYRKFWSEYEDRYNQVIASNNRLYFEDFSKEYEKYVNKIKG